VGFDRDTIVEDFAFALELVRRELPVWQSRTRISVLSPHDLRSFFQQRSRWFVGVANYLSRAPPLTQLLVGVRISIWTVSVTSSWLFLPLWHGYGPTLPLWVVAVVSLGSLTYVAVIGLGAIRIGGLRGDGLFLLFPLYAILEHLAPLYALAHRQTDFVVIEK
jgi:cellulose synthase/poly-beta-1,6-N-acetylglucosamine synthase-like glycosyltransferase